MWTYIFWKQFSQIYFARFLLNHDLHQIHRRCDVVQLASHNLFWYCLTNKTKTWGKTANSSPEKDSIEQSGPPNIRPYPTLYVYMSKRAEWKLGILPLGIQPAVAEGVFRPKLCWIQLGKKALCLVHRASCSAANHAGCCIHGALNHIDAASPGRSFAALETG
jgi:hypothetical protein